MSTGSAERQPTLEAPAYLRQKCREMQAEAPDLGLGYQKTRLPVPIQARLVAHFQANLPNFRPEGAVDEIRTSDKQTIPTLVFTDDQFNARLAEELRPMHEEWAGRSLVLSHCYGIRCYQRGTFLYNHVDRQPHFVSSTICVAHSLDSPWPLAIVDADGHEQRLDMEPGEMILYEGTRLAHGRPYPLDGDFYAGIFVHYYPAG